MEQNQRRFSIWYFVAAFLVLLAIEHFLMGAITENLTYNEFKALLKAGKITEVTLTDRMITGRLKQEGLEGLLPKEKIAEIQRFGTGEQRFVAVRVEDPGLVKELEEAKIKFAGRLESTWFTTLLSWILPALIFVGIWMFFMKRMGAASGLVSLGKSKAKVYMEKQTGVTFEDVAGIDEARAELMEIVDFLKTPDKYKRLGGKIPKGVLLAGPPGTGQDAPGQGRGRRGGRALLQHERLGVRGDVRRRGRRPGARPLRAGAAEGPLHHLHRRAGRPGQGARHRTPWAGTTSASRR